MRCSLLLLVLASCHAPNLVEVRSGDVLVQSESREVAEDVAAAVHVLRPAVEEALSVSLVDVKVLAHQAWALTYRTEVVAGVCFAEDGAILLAVGEDNWAGVLVHELTHLAIGRLDCHFPAVLEEGLCNTMQLELESVQLPSGFGSGICAAAALVNGRPTILSKEWQAVNFRAYAELPARVFDVVVEVLSEHDDSAALRRLGFIAASRLRRHFSWDEIVAIGAGSREQLLQQLGMGSDCAEDWQMLVCEELTENPMLADLVFDFWVRPVDEISTVHIDGCFEMTRGDVQPAVPCTVTSPLLELE